MRHIILILLALGLGGILVAGIIAHPETEESLETAVEIPIENELAFTETEYDFGVIKQSGGLVVHEFPFKYTGTEERRVLGVPTSCGCTTAEIEPKILTPGTEGVVRVIFDPNLHAEPEGRFYKTATVLTEPALSPEPTVKIWTEIDLDLGPEHYKLGGHDGEHRNGEAFHTITAEDLQQKLQEKEEMVLVDVHIPEQEHIPGTDAVIPFNEITQAIGGEIPADKNTNIVLYCRSGSMSRQAAAALTEAGYTNVSHLEGGLQAFQVL